MIIDMGYWTKVLRRLFIFILTIIGIYLILKLAVYYMPFLIALVVSLLLEPIIRAISNKTKLRRKTSAIIVLVIFSCVIIGILTFGIISIISESSNMLQGLNGYIEKLYEQFQRIINILNFDRLQFSRGISEILNNSTNEFLNMVSSWLRSILTSLIQSIAALPKIGVYIGITLISTYFICTDKIYILDQLEHHLPHTWLKRLMLHSRKIISSLGSYLRAEAILVSISFVITLVGLFIMNLKGLNVEYPLLVAIAIGFVDAMPIVGSGSVIIPWAIISAIDGDIRVSSRIDSTFCSNISC